MKDTKLVIFKKENVKDLLSQFGFQIRRKGTGKNEKYIVIDDDNQHICCPVCQKEIATKKVGTIAKGSRIIFCDNPVCFAVWVAQNKIS